MRYALNQNKYLLEPEYIKLTDLLHQYLEVDVRNCTLLLLALHTGARAQELLNLKKGDMNSYHEALLIHGLKGSDDREIPIPPFLYRKVEKVAESISGERIFPITYNRLRQIWQHYRPVHKKFHSLRHTFAIRLYKKTKDIRLLQVALGHRNITNTMVYADYLYSQEELKKLIL